MRAGQLVAAEKQAGFGDVQVQLGEIEAEPPRLGALGVGGHLVLGRGNHAGRLGAMPSPQTRERLQLAPGQDLRPS